MMSKAMALSSNRGRIHLQRSQARPQRSMSSVAARSGGARGTGGDGREWPPASADTATKGRGGSRGDAARGWRRGRGVRATPRFRWLRALRPDLPGHPDGGAQANPGLSARVGVPVPPAACSPTRSPPAQHTHLWTLQRQPVLCPKLCAQMVWGTLTAKATLELQAPCLGHPNGLKCKDLGTQTWKPWCLAPTGRGYASCPDPPLDLDSCSHRHTSVFLPVLPAG